MKKKENALKTKIAIRGCKAARRLLHLTGKGGTALPGKIALAFEPEVLASASRGMHVILVTGTNGKTTTCRMLEKALEESGSGCLLNRSGANLLSGITAEFVCGTDRKGIPRSSYAVIECDEGALKQVVPLIRPEVIVVTNLFRDQLDRYGEVMNTRQQILNGIRLSPDSILCLNADCPLTATLAEMVSNPVVFYGIDVPAGDQTERGVSDAKYCVHCGAVLSYDHYTYAHMGGWHCPECGKKRPDPEISVKELLSLSTDDSRVRLQVKDQSCEVRVGLPAMYNLYNALAAFAAGTAANLPLEALCTAAGSMSACFGRMERFRIGEKDLQMILVKNPAGFDQAAEFVTGSREEYDIALCLNDKTADGHDISWIWDADMEKVARDPHRRSIYVSGRRAEDLKLRFKYAGAGEEEIVMEKDWNLLILRMITGTRRLFVLPNYTSMLELRKELLKTTGGDDFWKG